MRDQIRFFLSQIREHLWVKPLMICLLSILVAFVARMADHIQFLKVFPDITVDSLETLLTVISGSMLGIAVFAVGSMISAYSSASSTATPRSFPLVIADDVSQNALSTFIGAFIYSIVALTALMNGYYGRAGRFVLFLITAAVFGIVIINFLRWLDRIARLGRLGNTIDRVEEATADALRRRAEAPTLGARKAEGQPTGTPIYAKRIGYVQRVDLLRLQMLAMRGEFYITVASLPGTFVTPYTPLAYISDAEDDTEDKIEPTAMAEAFVIGQDRAFVEDPRFGLIVLSEIASRALSPAVNDPGTAIDILGTFVRLFTLWIRHKRQDGEQDVEFNRVAVPEISPDEMFDDAFNAIARDGAGTIEVAMRLQKVLNALASLDDGEMRAASRSHARLAFHYAEQKLPLPEELQRLEAIYHAVESGDDSSEVRITL